MKNRIICCVMCLVMLVGCLCGCSEAEKVNKNISKQANYFETERISRFTTLERIKSFSKRKA